MSNSNRRRWILALLIIVILTIVGIILLRLQHPEKTHFVQDSDKIQLSGTEVQIARPISGPTTKGSSSFNSKTVLETADNSNEAYILEGRVVSDREDPVSQVAISIFESVPEPHLPRTNAWPPPLASSASDQEGKFHIRLDVPVADAVVYLEKPGYAAVQDQVGLTDPGTVRKKYWLQPACVCAQGKVISEEGKPIAGAKVFAGPNSPLSDNDSSIVMPAVTYSDNAGDYKLNGIAEGVVGEVFARAVGYTGRGQIVQLVQGPCVHADIHLEPANTISFAVKNTRGEAISNAFALSSGVHSVKADEKGIIQITLAKDAAPVSCDVGAPGYSITRLMLAPESSPSQVILEKGGYEVVGTVFDESGKPVRSAKVLVSGSLHGCGHEGNTDMSGRFSIPLYCPPAVSVKVAKEGFTEHTEPIEANRSVASIIVVIKKCNAEVYGRVVDNEGKPVTRFTMTLSKGTNFYHRDFDDDGSFRIADVPPGNYSLDVTNTPKIMVPHTILTATVAPFLILDGSKTGPLTIKLNPLSNVKK
jgi:hypothetical protein